jgi:hypothetical protein
VVVFLFASTASLLRAIDNPVEPTMSMTTLALVDARARLPALKILAQANLFVPLPQHRATAVIMATWMPLDLFESSGNLMNVYTATVLTVPK